MGKKKVHLGCNCHPYKYAWYIFCLSDLIEEDDYDKWLFTEKIEDVTCKKCIKIDEKLTLQLLNDGVITKDGLFIEDVEKETAAKI